MSVGEWGGHRGGVQEVCGSVCVCLHPAGQVFGAGGRDSPISPLVERNVVGTHNRKTQDRRLPRKPEFLG